VIASAFILKDSIISAFKNEASIAEAAILVAVIV
jgi:hypothetical protein